MRKQKVLDMLMGFLKKLHIKNKKLRIAIVTVIAIAIGVVSQMDESMFGSDIDKLPQTKQAVQKVIEKKSGDFIEDAIGGILKSIF